MSMELVEHIELASSASSITFANIPQSGKHLEVRISYRGTGVWWIKAETNGVAPLNHYYWYLVNGGYAAGSGAGAGAGILGPDSSVNAGYFYDGKITAQGYAETAIKNLDHYFCMTNNNGLNWQYYLTKGTTVQNGTAPMTSLTLKADAYSFLPGTIASLYIIS